MHINIFGKLVKINIIDSQLQNVLEKELKEYIINNHNLETENIIINFVNKIDINKDYFHSPSTHYTFNRGLVINYGGIKVKFEKNDILFIDVEYNTKTNFINQFRAIDFRSNIDNVGLVLHELIFVPMMFFYDEYALIHSSSMKDKNGITSLFGGTGGVGKTSLELLLCRNLGYSFISDDIAIIKNNSEIYPNLSYPKIYAYNVVGNKPFEDILLKDRTLVDKFQWNLFRKIKGDSKVRRSISPFDIFDSVETTPSIINNYYILSKTNMVDKIIFKDIDYKQAANITLDILKNEYNSVLQHIIWHEYNATLMEIEPILKVETIYRNWLQCYLDVLQDKTCTVIQIPENIQHTDFLNQIQERF